MRPSAFERFPAEPNLPSASGCPSTGRSLRGRLTATAMQCARHPSVETELACGKCGTPICPRCLVHTPVGARCRTCANVRRLPQYQVPPSYLARAVGTAVLAGAVLGALWAVLLPFGVYLLIGLLAGLGLGYVVGEAVSLATNRKAGPPLQAAAALGVLVAFVVRDALLAAGVRGVDFADVLTNDVFGWVVVIIAVVVAMGRVR